MLYYIGNIGYAIMLAASLIFLISWYFNLTYFKKFHHHAFIAVVVHQLFTVLGIFLVLPSVFGTITPREQIFLTEFLSNGFFFTVFAYVMVFCIWYREKYITKVDRNET